MYAVPDIINPGRLAVVMPSKRKSSGPQGGITKRAKSDHVQLLRLKRSLVNLKQECYVENAVSATGVSSSGLNFTPMPVPAIVDTGPTRRIGDTIHLTRIDLRVLIVGTEQNILFTADQYNHVGMRLGFVKNPRGSGALLGVGASRVHLMDTGSGLTGDANLLMPPIGWDVRDQFSVLDEQTFAVAGLDTANPVYSTDHIKRLVKTYRFKTPKKITFNSITSAAASFETQLPQLLFISDSALAPNPTVSWSMRFYYDA